MSNLSLVQYYADETDCKSPFCDMDVEYFIQDFAASESDATEWLEDQGIDRSCIGCAEVMRKLCKSWLENPTAVYAVCGTEFWREMKALAYEAWNQ